jgi:protein-L-isoaspartate(D-aspartate) O-methyltransferase
MMLFTSHGRLEDMLATITAECRATADLTGHSRIRPRVLQAMAEVARKKFVPPEMKALAFANRPLPIGAGQTISQPFIVALMTDLLNPLPDQRILEIGTGSGYQTAILARLAEQVFSIEILTSLAEQARRLLAAEGFRNIELKTGDGYSGWPEEAPFDGIMVTAAASQVPEPLRKQLKSGGRLVLPVGMPGLHQELLVIEKAGEEFRTRSILGVSFVPLVRQGEGVE